MVEEELVHPLPSACGGIGQVVDPLPAGVFRLLLAQVSLDVMAPFRLAGDHVPTQVTSTFVLLVTFLTKYLWL